MKQNAQPFLGILDLECGLVTGATRPPPRPGSILNPASYNMPVVLETVSGAWAEIVIRGDPALEVHYVAAAKRLAQRGAAVITANCGFSIRHQAAVSASVKVPVLTSSLLLLPLLLRQLPVQAKIAVLTADSTQLTADLLGIDDPADRERIVIGGVEGGEMWRNEMKRPPQQTDVSVIEAEVLDCFEKLRVRNSEIGAILLECTAFPLVASEVRQITKLPVYDITTLCRMMIASVSE
ncbi:hypothetical protein [Phyllobacterium chamaecytisi]|uniref:hypothetical protein n=1 Tax=Phyllobacterium chamaecytisi TaxID=2876082 RepID=UPI001CCD9B6D|nr:hypothetical protein [Phyllobacterium sp. KW56]MBZ9603037.1 hypothetical protein [Phyllobacterium sp. KW56]